jgi:hypothetical protein
MKTTIFPSILLVTLIGIISAVIFGTTGYFFGRELGSAMVYDASYEIGFVAAKEQNKIVGYEDGYNMGLLRGLSEGIEQSAANEIQLARNEAYQEGRVDGFDSGKAQGILEGFQDGKDAGVKEGLAQGINEGESIGRTKLISEYLQSSRSNLLSELRRLGYTCNTTAICERAISNDTQTGRRVWRVFDLANMTHSLNVDYLTDTGTQMKQRVIVDYQNGTLSAEWTERSRSYSSPFIIYDFSSQRMTKVNSNANSDTEFVFSWYNNAKDVETNTNIEWVLRANRN